MGYHNKEIPKGCLGDYSTIEEEYTELLDAREQKAAVLVICELCDLIGAIEAYVVKNHNLTLDDLIKMKDLTKKAFNDGHRK